MATKRKKKAGLQVSKTGDAVVTETTPPVLDEAAQRDVLVAEANKILASLNSMVAGVSDRRAAYLAFSFAYAKLVTDFDMDVDSCLRELSEMIASEKSLKTEPAVSTH